MFFYVGVRCGVQRGNEHHMRVEKEESEGVGLQSGKKGGSLKRVLIIEPYRIYPQIED